ncbi:MAG: hypothetical protein R2865_12820 [Deinococcales bacterium]
MRGAVNGSIFEQVDDDLQEFVAIRPDGEWGSMGSWWIVMS